MSKPTACTCAAPSDFVWHKAPANENGWHCGRCSSLAPGEPPGYRPDLDVSHLGSKVESLAMDLQMDETIYLSNSTDGEFCVNSAVKFCKATGCFDQYSIVEAIVNYANATHADYWKSQGDAIRAGADGRERCACGKLATSHRIAGDGQPPVGKCGDCSVDGWFGLLAAERPDPSAPEPLDPWEAYGLWEARWLAAHPDDDRDSLGLIEEYGKMSEAELRAFFDGIEAAKGKGGAS